MSSLSDRGASQEKVVNIVAVAVRLTYRQTELNAQRRNKRLFSETTTGKL